MMLHNEVQDNEVQDNEVQDNEVQDNEVQDNEVQDNEVQDNEVQDNEVQDNETQDNGRALLRPATIADWAQLAALDQQIFGHYGAQEDPAIIRARLAVFPGGCAVLEANTGVGAVIRGYLTTEKWLTAREPVLDEDPRLTHQPQGTVLNITTLAIAPGQQNQGLGSRLVAHAMAVAQREGCTQIVLETAHALAFYQRHHFTKIGERRQRNIRLHVMQYLLP